MAANCEIPEPKAEKNPISLPPGVPLLRSFYLYLTAGCNLCCRHCWITPTFVNGQPSPGEYIEEPLLAKTVEEALPLGLRHVKLTGGEPLLYPTFRSLVTTLSTKGIDMDMETNGTLIDAEMAAFLKQQTRINFISISLDSIHAEKHDTFRGVKGAFDRAVAGVKHLVAAGYHPQIIMSPHHGNIGEIDALVEMAARLGAGSFKFNPVTNVGRGQGMHKRGEALDYDEIRSLIRYVNGDLQKRSPIRLFIGAPMALLKVDDLLHDRWRGVCNVLGILGILGTGDMAFCGIGRNVPDLCFGKVGVDTLRDVWISHPVLRRLRQDMEGPMPGICGDCIHGRRCRTGCLAVNYMESGKLISPTRFCEIAAERGEFPATRRRNYRVAGEGIARFADVTATQAR